MMKKQIENTYRSSLLLLVFFCLLFSSFISKSIAQNKWLNFTNSIEVRDVVFQEHYAWIATSGGLLKMDLMTNEKYLFNRSNSEIPSNNISRLCLDSSGNLCVGTYDAGLAMFDGTNWKSYIEDFSILNSNKILSLLADSKGIIWIGTEMGLLRFYDGYLRSDWNIQGIIQDMVEDKNGAIWIGTTGELLRISDGKLNFWGQVNKPIPFFNVSNLSVGNDNKVWILAKEGLITYADSQFNKFNINSIDFPNGIISSFTADNQNNLWLASPYGRIAKYNGINYELFDSKNSELSGARINKIKVDKSGNVWACTGNGLYKYNYSGWEFIGTKTSIINSTQSTGILSDKNKNIWLVDGQDLYLFSKDTIAHYDKGNSKFKGAYSIAEDKFGKKWIGHSEGLTLFDGTYWKEIDTLETIVFNREKEIFEKYRDTAWVRENYKDYLLDSNSYFDAKPFVKNLTFDNSGNLWFSTSDELVKYDGKIWTLYDTTNSKIKTTSISDLDFDSENNLWIGTYTDGVIKFDGKKCVFYDSTNALIANRVESVSVFNDSVFISSLNGVAVFDGQNWNEIFLGVRVNELIRDVNSNNWVATDIGLVKFNEKDYSPFGIVNSGIANNYVQSACFDFDGNLWILSNGGINVFNEEGIKNEEKIKNFFTTF